MMKQIASLLFRPTETLYATAAIVGAAAYLGAEYFGAPRTGAALCGMAITAALRFAAIFWHIRLPELKLEHRQGRAS